MKLKTVLMAAFDVKASLEKVAGIVKVARESYVVANGIKPDLSVPCVVAVGKKKPKELLEEAYNQGQRHFGENYVQELSQKATYFKKKGINDMKWHFIGKLQRNKCNNLCAVPDLYMVETVDSVKLAEALNLSWKRTAASYKLNILVQINTSEEESKGGCKANEVESLIDHVTSKCTDLNFSGLMCIGAPGHDYSKGPNPDFEQMLEVREQLCRSGRFTKDQIELSMGMSADFEHAILKGSTIVRIGSTIFGARDYSTSKPDNLKAESSQNSKIDNCEKSKEQADLVVGTNGDSVECTEALKMLKLPKY